MADPRTFAWAHADQPPQPATIFEGANPGRKRGRAILFVDVDGVTGPFGAPPDDRTGIQVKLAGWPMWVRDEVRDALWRWHADPRVDVRWCTSWRETANSGLAARFDLPVLPVTSMDGSRPKVGAVEAALLSGAPVAWLDDDMATPARGRRLLARTGGPLLFVAPRPDVGLTVQQLARIDVFIERYSTGGDLLSNRHDVAR